MQQACNDGTGETLSLLAQRNPHATREDSQGLTFKGRLQPSLLFLVEHLWPRLSRHPLSFHDLSFPTNRALKFVKPPSKALKIVSEPNLCIFSSSIRWLTSHFAILAALVASHDHERFLRHLTLLQTVCAGADASEVPQVPETAHQLTCSIQMKHLWSLRSQDSRLQWRWRVWQRVVASAQ